MESLDRAKNRACYLLGARDYTTKQIGDKLLEGGYTEEVCCAVIDWLVKLGYLNDERYAHAYVRSHRGNQGTAKLKQELKRRGISDLYIYEALSDELDFDRELSSAVSLLEHRHIDFSKGPKEYAKHYRYLCGRGYSISIVNDALDHFKRMSQSV